MPLGEARRLCRGRRRPPPARSLGGVEEGFLHGDLLVRCHQLLPEMMSAMKMHTPSTPSMWGKGLNQTIWRLGGNRASHERGYERHDWRTASPVRPRAAPGVVPNQRREPFQKTKRKTSRFSVTCPSA